MHRIILYGAIILVMTIPLSCQVEAFDKIALNQCIEKKVSNERMLILSNSVQIKGNWLIDHCYSDVLSDQFPFFREQKPIIVKIDDNRTKFHGTADVGKLISVDLNGEKVNEETGMHFSLGYTYYSPIFNVQIGVGTCLGRVLNSNAIFWECAKDRYAPRFLGENPRFIWKRKFADMN